MSTAVIIIVVVGIVVVAAIIIAAAMRMHRVREFQEEFGAEYDRAMESAPNNRAGMQDLADRKERRDELTIKPLTRFARGRYMERWTDVQSRFVLQPQLSVAEADQLVEQVMRDQGYPVENFDAQADLVSVDHPEVVDDYRAAHAIAVKNQQQLANTEELRAALLHYRSLFGSLLEPQEASPN
jgi:hypothetical protein